MEDNNSKKKKKRTIVFVYLREFVVVYFFSINPSLVAIRAAEHIGMSIDGWTSACSSVLMHIVVLRLCIQCGRPESERREEREKRKKRKENMAIEHEYSFFFFCPFSRFFVSSTYIRVFSFIATIDRRRHTNETTVFIENSFYLITERLRYSLYCWKSSSSPSSFKKLSKENGRQW